ncbi:mannan endo-1,4-beta-mannosidase [Clostridia bacterium]|nr:mannan endo-1,4-beta-mannosidase [Clostridia bacterium]
MTKIRQKVTAFLLITAVILTGCRDIEYGGFVPAAGTETIDPASTAITANTAAVTDVAENPLLVYKTDRRTYSGKFQFEKLLPDKNAYRALDGYEADGYIQLDLGEEAALSSDLLAVPSAGHYRIGIAVCAKNAVVVLTANGVEQGAFYAKGAADFLMFYLDSVYLNAGVNSLVFKTVKGIAYLDYITINDTGAVPEARFSVSKKTANVNSSLLAKSTFDYLADIYGKKTLLSQSCTIDSMAEINAVYSVTGRHPAVRRGDLAHYSPGYSGDKSGNKEVELALSYAEKGGMVSFTWNWYSPVTAGNKKSHYLAAKTDFSLNTAFTTEDIAGMTDDQLDTMLELGIISEESRALISDMDFLAETLKIFRDNDVVVLWEPLPAAGVKTAWWGKADTEAYRWLWKTMMNRYSYYHALDNLIWVWSGEDGDYFPGNNYVDIVGESVYTSTAGSYASRFNAALAYDSRIKLTALAECAVLPDPDVMWRDNAKWLMINLGRGDYIIDHKGAFSGNADAALQLTKIYNHEMTLALGEVPELSDYGVE